MDYSQLFIETLDRAQERFLDSLDQVNMEDADVMSAPLIKSIIGLIWHIGSMIDLEISDLNGEESLWISDGLTKKFNLPLPDDTLDFNHSFEKAEK
ncbi:hypothetical protein, partial [Aerococcus urinaeequi]|uniref:DinB family protein n=1 Tax=Aerococcus urinaeequi TaxID=51665 RepID=A0AAC8WZG8_9LACT